MLKCEDISVKIGKKQILDQCSLGLKPGILTCIIGPNGAGKSTLLKVLTGVMKANQGAVLLDGQLLSKYKPMTLARQRAVMSQSTELNFNFVVKDVVMMGRQPYYGLCSSKQNEKIAMEALEEVDMADFAMRSYLTLSGGEKQRVQLARTISQIWESDQQRYLMLDEPINNLDLQHQHQCMAIARRFCDAGVAVLAVLHDLNLSFEYADEIVMMKDGRVIGHCSENHEAATEQLSDLFNCNLIVGANPYSDTTCVYSQRAVA